VLEEVDPVCSSDAEKFFVLVVEFEAAAVCTHHNRRVHLTAVHNTRGMSVIPADCASRGPFSRFCDREYENSVQTLAERIYQLKQLLYVSTQCRYDEQSDAVREQISMQHAP